MLLLLLALSAGAQTLARQGWVGSGYTVEPWWKGAVFYEIDPLTFPVAKGGAAGGLGGVIAHLDYLQALGVDAIVLPPIDLKQTGGPGHSMYLRPGSEDDFGLLIGEAIRRRIRVVVDLPLTAGVSDEELACTARFLLSRGAAALRLTPDPHGDAQPMGIFERAERLRALRVLCASYGSERVLLWDLSDASPEDPAVDEVAHNVAPPPPQSARYGHASRGRRPSTSRPPSLRAAVSMANRYGPQMEVDRRLSVPAFSSSAAVRGVLVDWERPTRRSAPAAVLASRAREHSEAKLDPAYARIVATMLLASRGGSLLRAGQELGLFAMAAGAGPDTFKGRVAVEERQPDSLLNWYRRLSLLRHSSAALHDGTMVVLPTSDPDVVAWTRRARVGGAAAPTVVVVCNLATHGNRLALRSELAGLGIGLGDGRLHPLLASSASEGDATAVASVDSLSLPAGGVFLGELRTQRGLETVTLPPRRSRRRSR